MAVVARVREKGELAVQEDDSVALQQEVLGRGSTAGTRAEVVDEADGLVFERHGGAARCDQRYAAGARCGEMVVDEFSGEGGVGG